jgi:hypothetical protein
VPQPEASLLYDDSELDGEDVDEAEDEDEGDEVGASKAHDARFPLERIPNPISRATPDRIQTVRWGDRVTLIFPAGSVSSPGSQQFADVVLPVPMVCSISFRAEIMPPVLGTVSVTILELIFGVGSANYTRQYNFATLPALLSPIDFVIPAVPLQRLQGRVGGVGFGGQKINATLSLAPVSGAR